VAAILCVLIAGAVPAAEPGVPGEPDLGLDSGRTSDLAARAASLKQGRKVLAAAKGPGGGGRSITVDCEKSSLQKAIDAASDGATIEISGICDENVLIEDKRLTLIGAEDGGPHGIQGDEPVPAVEVLRSRDFRMENLSVSNGPDRGIVAEESKVSLVDCEVSDNGSTAISASDSSELWALRMTITGNGGSAFGVNYFSIGFCDECEITGNSRWVAYANRFSLTSIRDSVASGRLGLSSSSNSYIDLDCRSLVTGHDCALDITGRAGHAVYDSYLSFYSAGDFNGQVKADNRSKAELVGARQVSPGFSGGDENDVLQQSRLTGDTNLEGFSRALLRDESVLDGTLNCGSGSDAWADSGVVLEIGASINGCASAPAP
jgi:hypothetical protein